MSEFLIRDPDYAGRVRTSFASQTIMGLIGAEMAAVAPGAVEIMLPMRADLCQQDGFIHAGVVTTIADSACGYAAMSLTTPGTSVLTIEFKANFVAPAAGERLIARGQVKKAGRSITVCTADVFAVEGEREKLVATMMASIMSLGERPDLRAG